jgi:hypothetical protein
MSTPKFYKLFKEQTARTLKNQPWYLRAVWYIIFFTQLLWLCILLVGVIVSEVIFRQELWDWVDEHSQWLEEWRDKKILGKYFDKHNLFDILKG